MKDYTLVIYKLDRRYKAGEFKECSYDHCNKEEKWMRMHIEHLHITTYTKDKYRIELHETYQTRTNLMTGETFQERFDTPYFCSPSRESYWAN